MTHGDLDELDNLLRLGRGSVEAARRRNVYRPEPDEQSQVLLRMRCERIAAWAARTWPAPAVAGCAPGCRCPTCPETDCAEHLLCVPDPEDLLPLAAAGGAR